MHLNNDGYKKKSVRIRRAFIIDYLPLFYSCCAVYSWYILGFKWVCCIYFLFNNEDIKNWVCSSPLELDCSRVILFLKCQELILYWPTLECLVVCSSQNFPILFSALSFFPPCNGKGLSYSWIFIWSVSLTSSIIN